ncbi:MAG: ClpXP protease specificity-enhancing factor SspB [Mariprofundaceae bacterium]
MGLSFVNAAKAKKLNEFFQKHGRIYVVVDATSDEVIVPNFLKGDPALRLVLNMRMPQPIHIREDALESDFSFSGQVYTCRVPMDRIWAAYLPEEDMEHGIVWEENVPETIRAVVNAVRSLQEDESGGEPVEEQVVEAKPVEEQPVAAADEPETQSEADQNRPGRKVRHLRVVK